METKEELELKIELAKKAILFKSELLRTSKIARKILNRCSRRYDKSIKDAKKAVSKKITPFCLNVQLPSKSLNAFGNDSTDPEKFAFDLEIYSKHINSMEELLEFQVSYDRFRSLSEEKALQLRSRIEEIKKDIKLISDSIPQLEKEKSVVNISDVEGIDQMEENQKEKKSKPEESISDKLNVEINNNKLEKTIDRGKLLNLEEAAKIIDSERKGLIKFSGGVLIDFCEKYAKKYELKEGEKLKGQFTTLICAEIILDGYSTTPGSVGSTLREKLNFKKKSH